MLCLQCSLITSSIGQNDFIEESGDVLQIAIPALAMGSTILYRDGSKPGWQFARSYGICFVTTHGLKRLLNKRRPNGGYRAFPSGHTSSAFCGASFLQKRYGWQVGLPSYLLAGYVGWTRIDADQHDVWDVIGGAAIGILSAQIFTTRYNHKEITAQIAYINNHPGIYLNVRFTN